MQGLASISEKYLKRKDTIFETFLGYLSKDKYLNASQKRSLTPKNLVPLSQVLSCVQGNKVPTKVPCFEQGPFMLRSNSQDEQRYKRAG